MIIFAVVILILAIIIVSAGVQNCTTTKRLCD